MAKNFGGKAKNFGGQGYSSGPKKILAKTIVQGEKNF
jgi:hypothetical protein